MSERKINLWNIINKFPQSDINHPDHNNGDGDTVMGIEEVYYAMKEAIKQALELAAENAEPELVDYSSTSKNKINIISVNKQSILRTIDQIE